MNPAERYIEQMHKTMSDLSYAEINTAIDYLHRVRVLGKKTFIMGNGGSASTASHFVCDLGKNTQVDGWPNFRVIGLSDNMALMTAYANDEGYETVFSRQLEGMVEADDLVIAISTSGNSLNVIRAVNHARSLGAATIGMTGFDGGKLGDIVDLHIHVPSTIIEQVEDIHLMVEHLICKALRERAMAEDSAMEPGLAETPRSMDGSGSPALLRDLISSLRDRSDLDQALQETLDLAVGRMGAASGSILVLDPSGEIVDGAVSYGGVVKKHPVHRLAEFLQGGLAGWVAKRGEAALIRDTRSDPRWLKAGWEVSDNISRSAVCVPLINDERLVGVLTLVNNPPNRFTEADLALLMAIAVVVSMNGASVFDRQSARAEHPSDPFLLRDDQVIQRNPDALSPPAD